MKGKADIKRQSKTEPYKIEEFVFNETSLFQYSLLSRYWPSTLFVADKEEDCTKIKTFFNRSFIYPNINCSLNEKTASNETENIIQIKKSGEKYRIYLTSRQNDLNNTNTKKNINTTNVTDFQEIIDLINFLNITDTKITDMNNLIDLLKGIKIAEILEILNISDPSIIPSFPGMETIGDALDLIETLNKTNFNDLNKIFKGSDLDQDQITNAFYVNNHTIETSFVDFFFTSTEKKYEIFFKLQSLLAKLLIYLEGKEIKSNFNMTFAINPYPEHYRFTDKYDRELTHL